MITKHAVRSHVTTNHYAIREWVETQGGIPARVKGTGDERGGGLLRISFAHGDSHDENLEPISWEEFFETFERNRLAFLYQDEFTGDDENRFFKFVDEDVAERR